MKINILTFFILNYSFISITFCYLRKDPTSTSGSYHVFPKTVQSLQPYIVRTHRHLNVLPTFQGPVNKQSVKFIRIGLDQSRKANNRLRKDDENCKCKDLVK
jgi:hypothetical protein